MTNTPATHHRRSIRLRGYDYSQAGAYFITICTHNRECLFGAVGAGSKPALVRIKPALPSNNRAGLEPAPTQPNLMVLNEYGEIVKDTWEDLINHVSGIELDAFVVMPNHVHGIIVITRAGFIKHRAGLIQGRAGLKPAPTDTHALPEIVRQMKTFSARRINKNRGTPGVPVWQRNYYEHIIRNEDDLNRIRGYIANNPDNWQSDENYILTSSNAVAEDFSVTATH